MTFVSLPDDDLFEASRVRTACNYDARGITGIINAAVSFSDRSFN